MIPEAEAVPTMAAMERLAKTYDTQAQETLASRQRSAKRSKSYRKHQCSCACAVCNPVAPRTRLFVPPSGRPSVVE